MSRFDTLTVEIEFVTEVWTDVTGYVNLESASLDFGWGRTNPYEQPSTGSLSLVLDNTDGRFTPYSALLSTGSANPYYPNVLENKRIRVTTTHSAVTYPMWLGYIDSYTAVFDGGEAKWSRVAVAASDRFKLLNRRQLQSTYEEVARKAGADAYFPLSVSNEEAGAEVTDKIRPAGTGMIVLPAANTASHYEWDNSGKPQQMDGAVHFSGAVSEAVGRGAGVVTVPGLESPAVVSAAVWFQTTGLVAATAGAGLLDLGSGWLVALAPDGTVVATQAEVGSGMDIYSTIACDDMEWHHLLVEWASSGTARSMALFVDGVSCGTSTGTLVAAIPEADTWVVNGIQSTSGDRTQRLHPGKATFSVDVAYSGLVLAASDLTPFAADLFNAGRYNLSGDSAEDRQERILGWCGLTDTEWDVADDTTAVIGAQAGNKTALQALQEVAVAEYAPVFVTGDGLVTQQSRDLRVTFTPAWTFDVDTDIDGSALQLALADEGVINQVTVSMWSGASATVYVEDSYVDIYQDSYSGALLNPISEQIDTPLLTIDQARDVAGQRLTENYQARLRMSPIVLTPLTASSDIWAKCFSLQLSDLIRVTGLTASTMGGSTLKDFYVEGIHWSISLHDVSVSLDTSAKDPQLGQARFDDTDTGRFGSDPGATTVGAGSFSFNEPFTTETADWSGYYFGGPTAAGQLTIPAQSYYDGITTTSVYDTTSSEVVIEFVTPPNVGSGTTEALFRVRATGTLFFSWGNNVLAYGSTGAGAGSGSMAYSGVNHRWLRIKNLAGTTYWDTSADGVSWTTRRSVATPIAINAMYVDISTGYYGVEGAPGSGVFDNLSITSYATSLAGTGTGVFPLDTDELWSTDSADYPANVKIDEEILTLSGVSGAVSPQSATISARAVSGTSSTPHSAGAYVELQPIPVFSF